MTENFSRLELVRRTRIGGKGKTQRNYLEFVVNGQFLSDLLKPGDYIGCLGWLSPESERIIIDELLTKQPSELGNDRFAIYICPECGDIGCGAITVQIEKNPDSYIWKNFGYENNYDDTMRDLERYKNIGPFQFKAVEYSKALTQSQR